MAPLFHDFQHGYNHFKNLSSLNFPFRNALQWKQRHCETHCMAKQGQRKRKIAPTLILYRSLKLLTHGHSELVPVYLQTDYMFLCNLKCN